MRLIFATHNAHKLSEIRLLLPSSVQLVSLDDLKFSDEIPETQDTLEGNALQKARFIYNRFNCACFADDTGLEVNALNGRPGVYSARYAGEGKNASDNIKKLLLEMQAKTDRMAVFRTVIAYIDSKNELLFDGIVKGTIAEKTMGDKGFGYDPVFVPDGHSHSFAQMTMEEKNKLSHRSIAVKKFAEYLKKIF